MSNKNHKWYLYINCIFKPLGAFIFDHFFLSMVPEVAEPRNTPAVLTLGAKNSMRGYLFSFLWPSVIFKVQTLEV